MNELMNRTSLEEKLETYLNRACQAEAEGNYTEAEQQFRYALYCEGRSRSDVENAKEYVQQAGPIYQHTQSHKEQVNIGDKNDTQIKN